MSEVQLSMPRAIAEELSEDLALSVEHNALTNYVSPEGLHCLAFVCAEPWRVAYHLGLLMAEWQPSELEWPGGDLVRVMGAFTKMEQVRTLGGWILYVPLIEVTP